VSALTVLGAVTPAGEAVALRAVDGRIAELGTGVVAQSGDEVLDAGGNVLVPGLVNGHTHAAMTLFRGYGSDLPLMSWLEDRIWPAEARLSGDDVYWGARAVCDAGLRATVGPPLLDGLDPARSEAACAAVGDALDELAQYAPSVSPSLAPHGIYTVSERSLEWVAEQSAVRDTAVHLHFLETASEVAGCLDRVGVRPGPYLERIGLLSPRLVLAHGVFMEDAELAPVAASGATVVTNPVSNLKLAVGRVFPYRAMRAHGIPVAIGTDGASSNNGLDVLQDVKLLALLQKFEANDPATLPAAEAWGVATGALSPFLGARPLAADEPADFLLVRASAPELAPGHFLDNLVYAAAGSVVDTTVVGGRVLLRDGIVADEEEVRAKAVECARRLGVL
jgi:5-methylthioadenosine/S-adenosylhomocysteine deaminase